MCGMVSTGQKGIYSATSRLIPQRLHPQYFIKSRETRGFTATSVYNEEVAPGEICFLLLERIVGQIRENRSLSRKNGIGGFSRIATILFGYVTVRWIEYYY